jgi:heme/copper-type cytochrome/quinol oxidase subunit 2
MICVNRSSSVANFLPIAIGKDWWLPTNYAIHGRETDALFQWFFWITLAVLIAVEVMIVVFVVKFRSRGGKKLAGHYHGNTRLEITWTLITGVILAGLAFGSERVWRDYRSSPDLENPNRSKILVIGQQFKWNVIYPGPDGKFGRYLVFPKPTDPLWPIGPDGQHIRFQNTTGPASLPHDEAVKAINNYIGIENPLGKDYSDPDGKDDDCAYSPGRPIYIPVNRPVEVQLESMDVIHDFFIPNFRAQLYAVPGMHGRFVFTPTVTTKELEAASRENISIDELIDRLKDPANADLAVDIDATSPGAQRDKTGWRYVDSLKKKRPSTIIRDGVWFAPGVAEKLKAAGITRVSVHLPRPFEVACAQLCGAQHYTMRNELIVLSQEAFDKKFPAAPYSK